MSDGTSPFDWGQQAASLGLPVDIYRSFLEKALDEGGKLIDEIEQALEKNDRELIRARAHRLKGDFGNLRMGDLMAAAQELNERASDENTDEDSLRALIDQLKDRVETARRWLKVGD